MAKNRFLDTMGLSENPDADKDDSFPEAAQSDDGVVLSSQPDGIGLNSAASDPAKDRSISISIQRGSGTARHAEVLVPVSRKQGTSEAVPASTSYPKTVSAELSPSERGEPKPDDLDAQLNLRCPECDGELVLMRRHIGIEGACVWCHVPIIAAESPRDQQVRVFPIFGRIEKAVPAPAVAGPSLTSEAVESAAPEPASKPEAEMAELSDPVTEPASADHFIASAASLLPGASPAPSDAVATSPVDFSSFTDFSYAPATPTEPGSPVEPEMSKAGTDHFETSPPPSLPDLESLYGSDGFGLSSENTAPMPGFGEALAGLPNQSEEEDTPVSGFGAFLRGPIPDSYPVGTTHPGPAAPISFRTEDQAPEPLCFVQAAPWGPPFESPAMDALAETGRVREDAAPASLPSGFASGFAEAFPMATPRTLKEEETPVAAPWVSSLETKSFTETPATPEPSAASRGFLNDFSKAFDSTGFESSFAELPGTNANSPDSFSVGEFLAADLKIIADRSPMEGLETKPAFTFSHDAAPSLLFGADRAEAPGSFGTLPGQGFATGSSPEPDSPSSAFRTQGDATHSGWGISEPIGGGAPEKSSVLFDESPFPPVSGKEAFGFSTPLPVETTPDNTRPDAEASIFSAADKPIFEPPSGPAVGPLQLPAGTETANPQVTSQPIEAKPKPTVRKGFVVLMVIIIGFASGAALASFVLPVDSYVQSARQYMEEKFTPGKAVQQMPSFPEISASEPSGPEESPEP